MKPSITTVHEAKTNLSRLLQKASRGEEVIIARGSKPVARLLPIGDVAGKRRPGALAGKLVVGPAFFEPLPADELAAWDEGGARSAGHACPALVAFRRSRIDQIRAPCDRGNQERDLGERCFGLGNCYEGTVGEIAHRMRLSRRFLRAFGARGIRDVGDIRRARHPGGGSARGS